MAKYVSVINITRPGPQPVRAQYCTSFGGRLRGLMFRRSLPLKEGILLVQGRDSVVDSSIHMLFMWIDLGVLWINQAGEVVDKCLARRWRPAYFPKRPARYVLEMRPEHLEEYSIGDCVRFEEAGLD